MSTNVTQGGVDFLKNATVILGILYSLYQGSAFIAGQIKEVENLKIEISRVQTHVEKIDNKIETLNNSAFTFQQSVENVQKIDKLLDGLEKTVLELEFKSRGR